MLTLGIGQWYGWQMLPGYGGRCHPYFTPIYVKAVEPLKKGSGHLRLEFFNAMYAQGVQDFTLNLKILKRCEDYLVADLDYGDGQEMDRTAIVSHIDFEWIKRHCPEIWWNRPHSSFAGAASGSVSLYLSELFIGRAA